MTTSRPEVRLNRPASISSVPRGLGECPLRYAGAHHRTSQRKHMLRQPGSCPLYEYDSRQHRIKKTVTHLAANKVILPKIYQYNDRNRITAPNTTQNTIIYSCIEALGLSGSLQNAGGLSVVKEASQTTQFVANQMIGNALGLFNTPTGNNSARYEYGPFGELIRATGPMAKLNPFRFSTKYQDDETDLVYYGYRYYNASTGRFLNQDPIAELGFRTQNRRQASSRAHNLYGFVRNSPTVLVDFLGLTEVTSAQPFCGAAQNADGIYVLHVDDGQNGTVELQRITMAEVEAEKKRLVDQLRGFEKIDGCKSRKYEGGFDSKYFAGEIQQHQYYLVDGQCPIYADNEINYIGIGLYEAWLCDSLSKAKAIVWLWKLGKWHDVPSEGTMHWLEVGYKNYQTLKSANDSCCRCGGDTPSVPGGRRR